jgi:hypothetical protein
MKFNVLDRVTLLGILPAEGNYLTYKIVSELKLKLSFSEDDIKNFNIREADGKILWDGSEDKEIEIGDKAKEVIKESLIRLDKAGKINQYNAPLYERFVSE